MGSTFSSDVSSTTGPVNSSASRVVGDWGLIICLLSAMYFTYRRDQTVNAVMDTVSGVLVSLANTVRHHGRTIETHSQRMDVISNRLSELRPLVVELLRQSAEHNRQVERRLETEREDRSTFLRELLENLDPLPAEMRQRLVHNLLRGEQEGTGLLAEMETARAVVQPRGRGRGRPGEMLRRHSRDPGRPSSGENND